MANDQQVVVNDTNGDSKLVPPDLSELPKVSKILGVISKNDALVILCMEKEGILADIPTCSKIDMTKRQYYSRLMQLKRTGLIQKREKTIIIKQLWAPSRKKTA